MLHTLLCAALGLGGAHGPLHPAGADLFLEITSPKDLWTARERAPLNKLIADEELKKLYALLEGLHFPVAAIGEAALPPALFGETSPFRALQHASFSASGMDAFSSASEMHIGIEGVLDFADPATAGAAFEALDGWKSLARMSDPAFAQQCKLGEHDCPLRWYQTGSEALERMPAQRSSQLWFAQDGARLYMGSNENPPERVSARITGQEPGLAPEAQLFAGTESMSPSSGLPIYRLWCDLDMQGLLHVPEFAAFGASARAVLPWTLPALLPHAGAKGVWRVEMRGERFVTEAVYRRYPEFESKGLGVGNTDASAARFVPKEAVGAWITNIDAAALEGEARTIVGTLLSRGKTPAEGDLRDLPLLAGGLGTHAAFYMLPINSVQALVPRAFLAVELKDKAQFEAALAAWATKFAALLTDVRPEARVSDKPYRKLSCVSISFGKENEQASGSNPLGALAPDMSLSPTIVVCEDRVLFGIKKTYVQSETRRIADGKSTELHAIANPELFPKDAFEASSMDWGGLFGKLLDIAKGLAPMAAGMMGENAPQIDASALPGSATLARFFKPTTSWSKRLADGRVYTRAESSFGPETPLEIVLFVSAAATQMKQRAAQPPPAAVETPEPALDTVALETQSALLLVKSGVAIYKIENARLPATLEELLVPTERYPQGYLAPQTSLPKDGWGHGLAYKHGGDSRSFQLYSYGPNGKDNLGAGDDVKAP